MPKPRTGLTTLADVRYSLDYRLGEPISPCYICKCSGCAMGCPTCDFSHCTQAPEGHVHYINFCTRWAPKNV